MDGQDDHDAASRRVNQWCRIAIKILPIYQKLGAKQETEAILQTMKNLVVKLLDNGIKKLNAAEEKLEHCSKSFNEAAGKLKSLHIRLENDFNQKSEYYKTKINEIKVNVRKGEAPFKFLGVDIGKDISENILIPEVNKKMKNIESFTQNLKEKVTKSSTDIDDAKAKLKKEIEEIGGIKEHAETLQIEVESTEAGAIKNTIGASVDELLKKCKEYVKNRVATKH